MERREICQFSISTAASQVSGDLSEIEDEFRDSLGAIHSKKSTSAIPIFAFS